MPNVELRWSDYRGSTFRVIRRVDDSRPGIEALVGEDLERGLYDFDTGTLLLRIDPDGNLTGGRVLPDGMVSWSQRASLGANLKSLVTWARNALEQPVDQ